MDKIILEGLAFYGYHGALKEENLIGQQFFIDIELYLDLQKAGLSDDLNMSVSYADIYEIAKKECTEKRYDLIEALAENIALNSLKEHSLIDEIMVRVRKPQAPVPGIFNYFAVEIRRTRNE